MSHNDQDSRIMATHEWRLRRVYGDNESESRIEVCSDPNSGVSRQRLVAWGLDGQVVVDKVVRTDPDPLVCCSWSDIDNSLADPSGP